MRRPIRPLPPRRCNRHATSIELVAIDTYLTCTNLTAIVPRLGPTSSSRISGLGARKVLNRIDQLTPREREVLTLAGNGQSYKQIARHLGISPRTVETHVARAIATLGARNRTEAALLLEKASVGIRTGPPALAVPTADVELIPADRGLAGRSWRNLPILRNGRLENDLTTVQRLGWMLAGALAIIIIFAQLAAGLRVAQEIALGLHL